MVSPKLERPLRSLVEAQRETRDDALALLRRALDRAEGLASNALLDLTSPRDTNMIASVLDHLRQSIDDLKDVMGEIAQEADEAAGAGCHVQNSADRAWATGR